VEVHAAARAAVVVDVAGSALALKLALGLGAVGGLEAFVSANELLANGAAAGFGGRASGVAAGRLADGLALGAVFLLALVLGAADGADGLLAVDGALSARDFLALHLATRTLADGVANSGAGGIIALPLAVRMALGGEDASNSHKGEESEGDFHHLYVAW